MKIRGCAAFAILFAAVALTAIGVQPLFAANDAPMLLRHVVLFKFNEDATPDDIREVETAFQSLPSKIPAIVDFESGLDCSVENLSQGFTHCFVVTFTSEDSRQTYLDHPDHVAFTEIVGPHLEEALVVDYWTKP